MGEGFSGGGGFRWKRRAGSGELGGGLSEEGEEQRKNVRGLKGSKEANARGGSLTESFCNLSLGLQMD